MPRDYRYRDYNEVTRYDHIVPNLNQYSIIDYELVKILLSKHGNNNFRMVGHYFVVRYEGNNNISIIDSNRTYEYNLF